MRKLLLSACAVALCAFTFAADFRDGWRFRREGGEWQTVSIPHDDAIRHDFDPKKYDTGCGALPCIGKAEYEKAFSVSPDEWRRVESGEKIWRLEFDGVMAGAVVEVNGKVAVSRPWGYASFIVPLDGLLKPGENIVRVRLDAKERSSRWTGFDYLGEPDPWRGVVVAGDEGTRKLHKAVYAAGCNMGIGHEPNGGVTTLEIPKSELPSGQSLTFAVRPLTSLGTAGRPIMMDFKGKIKGHTLQKGGISYTRLLHQGNALYYVRICNSC